MIPLHIGINALYLIPGGVGGTEIYLRNLLDALSVIDAENRYTVILNREARGTGVTPAAPNFEEVVHPVRGSLRPGRILWEQIGLPAAMARRRFDVLLNPGFTAPLISSCPMVTVFHDLQHKHYPEHFRSYELPAWRFFLWAAARRSRAVIAPSAATAADLLHYYGLSSERVRVIPHGIARAFADVRERRKTTPPEKILLTVSTLHPHKNLDRLVRAFAAFRKSRTDFVLVLIGLEGLMAGRLKSLISELGLQDSVRLTNWIPRHQVYEYFERAWAFFYPSIFEGFGLPVLEALAAGVPAACSDIEPLRSLAEDGCLTFDPTSEDAIRQAMERLTSDEALRTRLAARGPEIAAGHTWRASAEATLELLRTAAARK